MAKSLNLMTIAEGVESEADLCLLSELVCDVAQGYHFAKPLTAVDFERYVKESNNLCLL